MAIVKMVRRVRKRESTELKLNKWKSVKKNLLKSFDEAADKKSSLKKSFAFDSCSLSPSPSKKLAFYLLINQEIASPSFRLLSPTPASPTQSQSSSSVASNSPSSVGSNSPLLTATPPPPPRFHSVGSPNFQLVSPTPLSEQSQS